MIPVPLPEINIPLFRTEVEKYLIVKVRFCDLKIIENHLMKNSKMIHSESRYVFVFTFFPFYFRKMSVL